jgi:general secretion pathway protein N
MMLRFALALLLALLLLGSLVASAPARLLGMVLPSGQIYLQGLNGTLWNGSAARCMVQTGQGYLHLGAVRWTLSPLSLMLFSPRLVVESNWGNQAISGEVILRGSRDLDVYDLDASVSADLLRNVAPISLAGRLSAQLESMQLRDGLPVSARGRVTWENGGWQSPGGPQALGTYGLDLTPLDGGGVRGDIITVSGPVKASGNAELQGGEYVLDLVVGGERLDKQLRQALSLMAQPVGDEYRLILDGQL